ncbi:16S rRNA (uracil(1498)-N(3))-methyltransferase [bacterium]|nr:16S rRNA (uracil(1498)-N(3))-methyltransferase [bacterium]
MNNHDVYHVLPRDVHDKHLQLQQAETHHLIHVNRARVRDEFIAVDGLGTAYRCEVEQIADVVTARILNKIDSFGELAFRLTLAVAIPKKNRMEWIIEKGTEIGVAQFAPMITSRSIVQEASDRGVQRLTRIALSAMKQCCRAVLPTIERAATFESICSQADTYDLKIIAHEKQTTVSLSDLITNKDTGATSSVIRSGILCIGPEGGFSEEEVAFAGECGFESFGLGQRRLRTETAALVAATILLEKIEER